jgi:hypothetical protein
MPRPPRKRKAKGKMVTHSLVPTKHKLEGNNKTIVKGKAC